MFKEVHKFEIFDAYDENGNKLNQDIIRGQHKAGLYHIVVEILTINRHHQVLSTKRHSRKSYPLYWEITGGSILKGETDIEGAIRELYEETGICVQKLIPIYNDIYYDAIFRGFIAIVDEPLVKLQEDETIDYKWIEASAWIEFIQQNEFIPHTKKRPINNW